MIFESKPSSWNGAERRASPRFPVQLPLTVRWFKDADVRKQTTRCKNVSNNGVYFLSSEPIPMNTPVEVLITLSEEITLASPMGVRCLGRVVRTEAMKPQHFGVVVEIDRYEILGNVKRAVSART